MTTTQEAITALLGSEIADIYDAACQDWAIKDQRLQPYLTDENRPKLVPASVVPYGHPWLAWISGADTDHPIISVPTRHGFSLARWKSGVLKPVNTEDMLQTLRHELGHLAQAQIYGGVNRQPNVHFQKSWFATIGHWHGGEIECHDTFVQTLKSMVVLRLFDKGLLKSYPFPDDAPRWAIEYGRKGNTIVPAAKVSDPVLLVCQHCSTSFKAANVWAKFCSPKCRVSANRAALSPEMKAAKRAKDAMAKREARANRDK